MKSSIFNLIAVGFLVLSLLAPLMIAEVTDEVYTSLLYAIFFQLAAIYYKEKP